jgi:hypothetical protein
VNNTEQADLAVALQDLFGDSWLESRPEYPPVILVEVLVVFFGPSRQIPGQYLN